MKFILLLLLLPIAALAADEPTQSPRDATPAELIALTNKIAKSLHACAYSRRNKDVAVEISNRTEDYMDKEPLVTALMKDLKLKAGGKKAVLKADFSSTKSVKAGKFESTYTITARYLQNGKKFCEKSQALRKKGTL
jgi:hypothetical protein